MIHVLIIACILVFSEEPRIPPSWEISNPINMPMIEMTTSSSMRVNPCLFLFINFYHLPGSEDGMLSESSGRLSGIPSSEDEKGSDFLSGPLEYNRKPAFPSFL